MLVGVLAQEIQTLNQTGNVTLMTKLLDARYNSATLRSPLLKKKKKTALDPP